MKRTFAIALIVIFLFSLAAFPFFTACKGKTVSAGWEYGKYVSSGKTDISIGVIADAHVMSETQAVDMTSADYKAYESKGQKMLGLSESILKTAVDRIIKESDLDVVLLSGDNADDGGAISHRAVATELQRLEDAGIRVFVIPGNHDINNRSYTYAGGSARLAEPLSEAGFASVYRNFGYDGAEILSYFKNDGEEDETVASFKDGDNLSYVADLSDKYRLIAIDMTNHFATNYLKDESGEFAAMGEQTDENGNVLYDGKPYPNVVNRHKGAMTESLLLWAKQKTEEAIADGKIPLGMMHFPLIAHFGPMIKSVNMLTNDPGEYFVADVLADAGMRYIFTGHIHIQDNAMYTSKNGNKILDINSASLANYPTPIRVFQAKGEEVFIRTWNMNEIREDYLPSYLSVEEKASILSDFTAYSVAYIDDSMLGKVKNTVNVSFIKNILGKFGIKSGEGRDDRIDALAASIYDELFLGYLKMPIYKKDADGKTCIESIAEKYGVTLPSTEYTSVLNLSMRYAAALYAGDESVSVTDEHYVLLKYALFSFLDVADSFDLFGKMRALNDKIGEIDLASALPALFNREILDVCSTNLLVGVLSALDIPALKNYVAVDEDTNAFKLLDTIKTGIGLSDLEDRLMGLDLSSFIITRSLQKIGYIKLGALADACFTGKILLCMANDRLDDDSELSHRDGFIDTAPADNNLRIDTKTMAYYALK